MNTGFQVQRHAARVLVTDGVNARTANQLVRTSTTDQRIVTRTAGNDVVRGIANAAETTRAGEGQALDLCGQGHAGLIGTYFIVSPASSLVDRDPRPTDDVHIITGPALKGMPTGLRGQRVVEGRAHHRFDGR